MPLAPMARKLALTLHVVSTVGWLGAVVATVALAVAGLRGEEEAVVRAAYVAMDLVGRHVLVPLALASLATGLVMSLGTTWGLLRHWWVVLKLAITLASAAILLAYTRTFRALGALAADPTVPVAHLQEPSPLVHGVLALLALLAATALSISKPKGLTRYGWRKEQRRA